jgi:hypothetical protein
MAVTGSLSAALDAGRERRPGLRRRLVLSIAMRKGSETLTLFFFARRLKASDSPCGLYGWTGWDESEETLPLERAPPGGPSEIQFRLRGLPHLP